MTRERSGSGAATKLRRDIFSEVREGLSALSAERSGKVTLRSHAVEIRPPDGHPKLPHLWPGQIPPPGQAAGRG